MFGRQQPEGNRYAKTLLVRSDRAVRAGRVVQVGEPRGFLLEIGAERFQTWHVPVARHAVLCDDTRRQLDDDLILERVDVFHVLRIGGIDLGSDRDA
ncbi:hypothetical protein D9M72_610240 [compost metagenome]